VVQANAANSAEVDVMMVGKRPKELHDWAEGLDAANTATVTVTATARCERVRHVRVTCKWLGALRRCRRSSTPAAAAAPADDIASAQPAKPLPSAAMKPVCQQASERVCPDIPSCTSTHGIY
jgi:hypothetical protein